MNHLSSKVVIQHGKTRFAGMSEGIIAISNGRLVIRNSTQTFLDVPLAEIKKTNFQFTLLYVYTTNDGVKVVDFKTKEKTDEQASLEMQQWIDKIGNLGLNVRDSRKLFLIIASVLVIFAVLRVLVGVFG